MITKFLVATSLSIALAGGTWLVAPCSIAKALANQPCPDGYCQTAGGCCKLGSGCACQ